MAKRRVIDVGVLESERVKPECRLEQLRLDEDEVDEEWLRNTARISSILASFSCL